MSDSEASEFRFDDSDSDGYVETIKEKKAPAKKPAPKTAPKKATTAKRVPLGVKKNLPNDSGSDTEAPSAPSVTKRKADADDDVDIAPGKPAAKKTASEMYQKLSQLEHVLKRPDTYIGSVEAHTQPMWVLNPETKEMENRTITFVPGFFKIFDEILVNAADNKINDPTMDMIKVVIDREKNQISVMNNGKGIPIEMHSKEGIMIPELIFGNLLTSSNYDDDQKKLTGGRNGYGAKLANIYSTEFIVETADKGNRKKYKQVFSNNMTKKGAPKITENKKGEEWTKITYTPDLSRFGMTGIDDDTYSLLMKRVYDVAGTVKNVKVVLNDERLKIKGFKQYVEMYLAAGQPAPPEGVSAPKPAVVYEAIGQRWEIAFALSDGEFKQVSFANSIATIKGGTHVDMVATQLATKLLTAITKKNKAAKVKPAQIKNQMWIFVNALVENPSFDSQTKETLTLKASAFGSKCELSEEFVKKVIKSGIVENVLEWARFKQDQQLKKTDGAKRSRINGIAKLDDANWAGGKKASQCTLILTEGDSAKATAVSGLGAIQGRDTFGVFPLRGKLLNVREASHDQIMKNVEIQHIKTILGLKHNHNYTSTDSLRYGQLMIMTDQDHDGSHIKGLIINFLDHFYPSLLRIPNFLVEFITPIVKVWKGKGKNMHSQQVFYTMPQYEKWKEENNGGRGWESKYLKGLGSSEAADARRYFSEIERHRLAFEAIKTEDHKLLDMAFNKKRADDRKEWLRQFKPGTFLDPDLKTIPIDDFVNKELILFSMADNIRSIPSVADGLKPGQRKVLYGAFKKKITSDLKVAQLSGYVSEKTAYHHGEQSLQATIVGLAQNFVGSNNINLLEPNGQFGTRNQGGKDAASARYIFTNIPRMTRLLFHKDDDPILDYLVEDGDPIEPEYYLPTVPLVLVNGADGIGTGWSTSIPSYNPEDIVENLRRLMRNEEMEKMTPWFRGFKGTIERIDNDRFKVSGIATKTDDKTIEITELPIRKWTQDFKEMLDEMANPSKDGKDNAGPATIKDFEQHHTDASVHFKLHMTDAGMKAAEAEGFEKRFKLTTTCATSNMVCFDLNGKIKKYASPEDILQDFYPKRLEYYGLRKQHLADELDREFDRLSNQARFITMIIQKDLVIAQKKKSVVVAELRKLKFRPFPPGSKLPETESAPTVQDEDEEQGSDNDYDYLLNMALSSLTAEKVAKLLAQRDLKEEELTALLKLSPQDIWNQDLDEFLAEWKATLDADEAVARASKPKTKAQIKRAVTARKRAKGEDTDDSEDDFKPAKATKASKASKPRALSKTTAPAAKTAVASTSTSASPVKREFSTLSGSDTEVIPTAKKTTARARKPVKPIATVDIDDSEDDANIIAPSTESSKPPSSASTSAVNVEAKTSTTTPDSDDEILAKFLPTKSAAKAKPAAKAKSTTSKTKAAANTSPSHDDSENEDVAPPKPRATGKSKAKAVKKEKSDSDGESDILPGKGKSKAAPKKRTTKGKTTGNSDFEDASDSDGIEVVAAPARTTSRARAAAKKPVYVDLSDLDDDSE